MGLLTVQVSHFVIVDLVLLLELIQESVIISSLFHQFFVCVFELGF